LDNQIVQNEAAVHPGIDIVEFVLVLYLEFQFLQRCKSAFQGAKQMLRLYTNLEIFSQYFVIII
jgi:hypothetical protein